MEKLSKSDLIALNVKQQALIDRLEFEMAQLKRAIFGSKSERFVPDENPAQGNLFFEKPAEQIEQHQTEHKISSTHKKPKNKPVRQKIPSHLPRKELVVEPELDTSGMQRIGVQESEKLEMEPAKFYVKRILRPKYIDHNNQIHIAPLNDPFPKCMAGTSVVSHVVIQKYVDHLPLYRQSKIYKREQIDLPRSTLNGMTNRSARLLEPLYDVLSKLILEVDYLQADESSIPVLTTDKPGSALKGCMLAKVAPTDNLVVFDYIKTKEKPNILKSLAGFKGYLQVDGNVTYQHKGKEEEVSLMHCMVHSRRKFDQALEYDRKRSAYVLNEIKKLYLLERQMSTEKISEQAIAKKRQQEALPILNNLKKWLERNYDDEAPSNPFKTATRYMLLRWAGLTKYIEHGKLRPDNNLIENQIRPLALGRKNYLFAGSHRGAKNAAIFYSLIATCRLNNIEPKRWLQDVLNRIGDHHVNKLTELLPTDSYQFSSQSTETSVQV